MHGKLLKKKLICVIPLIGRNSLQLRTCLVNSIESNLKLCKHKLILQSPYKLNPLLCYKDPLEERLALSLFTDMRVVTAWLLFVIKHTTTFSLELQSIQLFLI